MSDTGECIFEHKLDNELAALVVELEGELDLFAFDQLKDCFFEWKQDKKHPNPPVPH